MQAALRWYEAQSAASCVLPAGIRVDFPADPCVTAGGQPSRLLKTRTRMVASLQFGVIQAREISHVASTPDGRCVSRSAELAELVPAGCRYAYDLIVEVGLATFLEGRQLEEVREQLQRGRHPLLVPHSSLWQLQRRFLFYLGAMHRQALPKLREYLTHRGGYTALLDGTCELGSPVLLGVTEAEEEMILGSWKIPSENRVDVRRCLGELTATAGRPSRVLHDLSGPLREACEDEFPGIAHRVCHYHFARDVGSDLYEQPQAALVAALRRHKLVARLHDQRKEQVRRLAEMSLPGEAGSHSPVFPPAPSLLARWRGGLWAQGSVDQVWREVVVALHHWILDYAHEGSRRGFPFDPYLLYQHRRWQTAEALLRELLAIPGAPGRAPRVLTNLQQWLHEYLSDAQVTSALVEWGAREKLFHRLRDALRLETFGSLPPLSDSLPLGSADEQAVAKSLAQLERDLEGSASDAAAQIILKHLHKYQGRLVNTLLSPETLTATVAALDTIPASNAWSDRTNNKREAQWRELKRARRRVHGRGKLTVELAKLPAAWGLVPNLLNPRYLELVVGSLDHLAAKFAQAASTAGSYIHWQAQQAPRRAGQMSKRELRSPTFLSDLRAAYADLRAAAAAKTDVNPTEF